jgi:hypothetical protein
LKNTAHQFLSICHRLLRHLADLSVASVDYRPNPTNFPLSRQIRSAAQPAVAPGQFVGKIG